MLYLKDVYRWSFIDRILVTTLNLYTAIQIYGLHFTLGSLSVHSGLTSGSLELMFQISLGFHFRLNLVSFLTPSWSIH